jgi:hypothetical protein
MLDNSAFHCFPSRLPFVTHSTCESSCSHDGTRTGNAAILKAGKDFAHMIQADCAHPALPGTWIQNRRGAREKGARARDPAEPADRSDGSCRLALSDIPGRVCRHSEKVKRVVVDAKVGWLSLCFTVCLSIFISSSYYVDISPLPQTGYPAVYNAVETLLVHQSLLDIWLNRADALLAANVKLFCDELTLRPHLFFSYQQRPPIPDDPTFLSRSPCVPCLLSPPPSRASTITPHVTHTVSSQSRLWLTARLCATSTRPKCSCTRADHSRAVFAMVSASRWGSARRGSTQQARRR